jgi:hypothetical protein
MLVLLTDAITNKPTAVNPDQVQYISPDPNEENRTRIRFTMDDKFGFITVQGDFSEVLIKLNAIFAKPERLI